MMAETFTFILSVIVYDAFWLLACLPWFKNEYRKICSTAYQIYYQTVRWHTLLVYPGKNHKMLISNSLFSCANSKLNVVYECIIAVSLCGDMFVCLAIFFIHFRLWCASMIINKETSIKWNGFFYLTIFVLDQWKMLAFENYSKIF